MVVKNRDDHELNNAICDSWVSLSRHFYSRLFRRRYRESFDSEFLIEVEKEKKMEFYANRDENCVWIVHRKTKVKNGGMVIITEIRFMRQRRDCREVNLWWDLITSIFYLFFSKDIQNVYAYNIYYIIFYFIFLMIFIHLRLE